MSEFGCQQIFINAVIFGRDILVYFRYKSTEGEGFQFGAVQFIEWSEIDNIV